MKVIIQTGARPRRAPFECCSFVAKLDNIITLHRLITNFQGILSPIFLPRRCPLPDGSLRHLVYKICSPQTLNLASAPDFLLIQDDHKTICILSFTDVPIPLRQKQMFQNHLK